MCLWGWIQQIELIPDREDSIVWNLNNSGTYTAASAYTVQFHGSHPEFEMEKIWFAHAEPKCKLFSWLALHGRILTNNMLAVKGWPHDPHCQLCLQAPETVAHLCKDRSFVVAA